VPACPYGSGVTERAQPFLHPTAHGLFDDYGGRKTFHHPDVGDLTLGYQSMQVEGTPDHRMVAYHAEPGSAECDAMVLLDLAASEAMHAPRIGAPRIGLAD
jgi:hypothetical protein